MATENTQADAENQPGSGNDTPEKIYTKEDMQGAAKKRIERLNLSWQKKMDSAIPDAIEAWRDEQGLTDEAIAKLTGSDEQATALRKSQAQLKKFERERSGLEDVSEARAKKLEGILGKQAVITAAVAAGAKDPDDIWAMCKRSVQVNREEWTAEVIDKSGEVQDQTIGDLVSGLLTDKPYLANASGSRGSGSNGPANGAAQQQDDGRPKTFEEAAAYMATHFPGGGRI